MSENQQEILVTANEASHRFEAEVDGKKAFLQYYLSDGSIVFTHTEVPKDLEGQGIGGVLAKAGLAYARAENLTVTPLCPFVEAYVRKHPRDMELVEPGYRSKMSH
jgi:uncharacterized protein